MNVLLDFHHHALAESYALTLADRFGWDLYFPAGMEWFDAGIWQFEKEWHGDRVARQYLEGIWDNPVPSHGAIVQPDKRHPNRYLQGVSLGLARDMEWDVVISSLPHNDDGYHRFAEQHSATFGVQVGNDLQHSRWDLAEFVLASSTIPGFGPQYIGQRFAYMGKPAVMYHQEFSLDIFSERPPAPGNIVASFVNCFPETYTYPAFVGVSQRYAEEFDFRVYGAYGSAPADDLAAGDISWVPDIADEMAKARMGWHSKIWSDGFGHVIHDWFAIGRPVIGHRRYYADKIAGPLWDEGKTAFDIDTLGEHGTLDVMRRLRDDDDFHASVCEASAARFREVVDFDAEAEVIRSVIEDAL